MKIITFAVKKGGVGKTTLAYNYIGWLANKGFKVLAIDLDSQCNLTATYDIYDQNNTIGELFDIAIKERSEEHTSELQSRFDLVCRLLLEKKKKNKTIINI